MNNTLQLTNSSDWDFEALGKVDECLIQLSNCKSSEASDLVEKLVTSIMILFGKNVQDSDISSLFSQKLSHDEKRFIATCLLRLLFINEDYFQQNRDFRIKAFSLFDQTLSDLYKEIDITTKQQTYEKLPKLKDVSPRAEQELRDVIDALVSLDRIDDFREQYMKAINSIFVKTIIVPFIPRKFIHRSKLGELFDAIRHYRQASGLNVRFEFEEAQLKITDGMNDAQNLKTKYSKEFIVLMFDKMNQQLAIDFLSSDLGQPAKLEIKTTDKRYPLHQTDQSIKIGLSLMNYGPGYAYDVVLMVWSSSKALDITKQETELGRVAPGTLSIEIPARVLQINDGNIIDVGVLWKNADGHKNEITTEINLISQRTDINWQELEYEDPYNLEPVESIDELVGRKEILNSLIRQTRAKSIGSSFVFGQKRVGKTSIVKTLKSFMNKQDGLLVIYLEGGEYVDPSPEITLATLGKMICERIQSSDHCFEKLEIPNFEKSLSPMANYLENAHNIKSDLRALIILDEFDELPIRLYRRSEIADAFFLTLRTISGKPPFGIVLVGGEKMEFVMSCQGEQLNKFQVLTVDYFDKETQWSDFQELVRKPTNNWLEITDDAILQLYEQTAGNPFYTIFICRELFKLMLQRRDCYVTSREISDAIDLALKKIATNGFQHFWEDGIFEISGDRVEEISMRRRRILIALANVLREKVRATKQDIANQPILYADKEFLDSELRRFVERRVLIEESGSYDCKVPLFKSWLTHKGVREILTTFSDLDAILERRKREEESYVKSDEIVNLVSRWGLYQGVRITEDQVRMWLAQFGDYFNQRLMFKILQGLKYYSDDEVRAKMKEAHGIVARGLVRYKKYKQVKRGDILVSYLDGIGKSGGGRLAKLYADENEIYKGNVVELGKLTETLTEAIRKQDDVQAVVFIDDFIATGESASKSIRKLIDDCGDVLKSPKLVFYILSITGFDNGVKNLEKTIFDLKLPVSVHICDPIDETYKCFDINSRMFPEEGERLQAMQLAKEFGYQIVKENSLGFGNCQSAIIFPDNCPNNNLPILWAESENPPWTPLFKRAVSHKN